MNKNRVASIINKTIDTRIPQEVSRLVKANCPVVVNDLSKWDISLLRHNSKDKELLGAFGFEDGKPVIGINHKTLKTTEEVIKTTKHESAHSWLWHQGLPNGERAANKLVKQWEDSK